MGKFKKFAKNIQTIFEYTMAGIILILVIGCHLALFYWGPVVAAFYSSMPIFLKIAIGLFASGFALFAYYAFFIYKDPKTSSKRSDH